jgi:hypothetical protein
VVVTWLPSSRGGVLQWFRGGLWVRLVIRCLSLWRGRFALERATCSFCVLVWGRGCICGPGRRMIRRLAIVLFLASCLPAGAQVLGPPPPPALRFGPQAGQAVWLPPVNLGVSQVPEQFSAGHFARYRYAPDGQSMGGFGPRVDVTTTTGTTSAGGFDMGGAVSDAMGSMASLLTTWAPAIFGLAAFILSIELGLAVMRRIGGKV